MPIDVDRLRSEYDSIPDDAWGVSYWDVHCSIDVLLLRGGDRGTEDDFGATDIRNSPILDEMPYTSSLLAQDGPLGGARYAFIFRTKPDGITRIHDDLHDFYQRAMRVHVPIITNPGAFLLSEGRSKHFAVGEMWTFDNQSQHSVVNGDTERVHMIIDVDPNPALAALIDDAVFDPGDDDPQRWARTLEHAEDDAARPFIPYDGHPLTITEKTELGLDVDGFATRIVSPDRGSSLRSMLLRFGLCPGDILVSVDGVSGDPLSRTATDHIRTKHRAGDTVRLGYIRDGRSESKAVVLRSTDYFGALSSARQTGLRATHRFRQLLQKN